VLDGIWWSAKAAYRTVAERKPFSQAVSYSTAFRRLADCLQRLQVIPACAVEINSLAKRESVSLSQFWTGNHDMRAFWLNIPCARQAVRGLTEHECRVYKNARLLDCLVTPGYPSVRCADFHGGLDALTADALLGS